MREFSGSVHVLGVGSIGGLIALELANLPSPPKVTLLWRNVQKVKNFQTQYRSTIRLDRLFKTPTESFNLTFDSATAETLKEPIKNLIVSTKTYQTQSALKPYSHLINNSTNIILIQNGLGVSDELFRDMWPNSQERPNIYQGVITHGALASSTEHEYTVSHTGLADLSIAELPGKNASNDAPLFIQQLLSAPSLNAKYLPYSELLLIQLQKVMMNSCINSLTAIMDCLNGDLYCGESMNVVFKDIIRESIYIFKKCIPELKDNPRTEEVLNEESIFKTVVELGILCNLKTSTSMRQDVLNLRRTEIDYINGYVVSLAKRHNLKADVNSTIANLVRLKLAIGSEKKDE